MRPILLWAIAVLTVVFVVSTARAQHNHAAGHDEYRGWSSQKTGNCCNNQDCGALSDDQHRETAIGAEVLIEGEWCPVLREHYLTRGRSPDWNVVHACVRKHATVPPCEKLLCYSGKGGF